MTRVIVCVCLLVGLTSTTLQAAWAHVQTDTATAAAGSTIAKAFSSDVTAGSQLIGSVGWFCNGSETISSVVGSSSGAWAQIGSTVSVDSGGFLWCLATYGKSNAAGGADTITVTFSTSLATDPVLGISEYSGIATSSALDQTTGNAQIDPGTATDAVTSTSVTTTAANELIYGASLKTPLSHGTFDQGTGYTSRGTVNDGVWLMMRIEDKNLASAGSVAATFTTGNAAEDTMTIVATFKEPSVGGCRNLLMLGVGCE